MEILPEPQTTSPTKAPHKPRRSKTKQQSVDIVEFEALLRRRQELTRLAHQAQDKLDTLKALIAQAEIEAEGAWDLAIDMNAVIREQLTNLRNNGVPDKTIYSLIDRYNAV